MTTPVTAATAPQTAGMSAHPTSYLPAEWRGTLPPDAAGRLAFSLDLPDGTVARYTLSAEHAKHLRETLDPAILSTALHPTQSGLTTKTVHTFAADRLGTLRRRATNYLDLAHQQPARAHSFAHLIDRLIEDASGLHHLSALCDQATDHSSAIAIDADLQRTIETLIGHALEARMVSVYGRASYLPALQDQPAPGAAKPAAHQPAPQEVRA